MSPVTSGLGPHEWYQWAKFWVLAHALIMFANFPGIFRLQEIRRKKLMKTTDLGCSKGG